MDVASTQSLRNIYYNVHSEQFIHRHGTSRLYAIKCGAYQLIESGIATFLAGVTGISTVLKLPFQAVRLVVKTNKRLEAINKEMLGIEYFIGFVIHCVKNVLGFLSSIFLGAIVSPSMNLKVQNCLGNITDKELEDLKLIVQILKKQSNEKEKGLKEKEKGLNIESQDYSDSDPETNNNLVGAI